MNRKPFICGNWKMYKNRTQTIDFIKKLCSETLDLKDRDILIAPVYLYLDAALALTENTAVLICAQDVYFRPEGAYTGEISPVQLRDIGCTHTLIGHSERRKYFFETDEIVNLKTRSALWASLMPIVCIGETREERQEERTFDVLSRSLKNAFHMIERDQAENVTVAYEPVWAIGTGLTATPEIAQEAHNFIRKTLAELYGREFADKTRILYGGSVKPGNIKGLMSMEDIDGVLVGGASLSYEDFMKIIRFDCV